MATASSFFALLFIGTIGLSPAMESEGMLKAREVRALVANAKTAADHMKLARHFTAMAAKHEADAVEHEALAEEYARLPRPGAAKMPMSGNTPEHCKYYAEHCRKAAAQMRALAAAHEEMAKKAGK
jgi:hypothetical protein